MWQRAFLYPQTVTGGETWSVTPNEFRSCHGPRFVPECLSPTSARSPGHTSVGASRSRTEVNGAMRTIHFHPVRLPATVRADLGLDVPEPRASAALERKLQTAAEEARDLAWERAMRKALDDDGQGAYVAHAQRYVRSRKVRS